MAGSAFGVAIGRQLMQPSNSADFYVTKQDPVQQPLQPQHYAVGGAHSGYGATPTLWQQAGSAYDELMSYLTAPYQPPQPINGLHPSVAKTSWLSPEEASQLSQREYAIEQQYQGTPRYQQWGQQLLAHPMTYRGVGNHEYPSSYYGD